MPKQQWTSIQEQATGSWPRARTAPADPAPPGAAPPPDGERHGEPEDDGENRGADTPREADGDKPAATEEPVHDEPTGDEPTDDHPTDGEPEDGEPEDGEPEDDEPEDDDEPTDFAAVFFWRSAVHDGPATPWRSLFS